MSMMRFTKGVPSFVSPDFRSTEYDCPCGRDDCTETFISTTLAARVQKTRNLLGVCLHVNRGGGYRCHWYQEKLRSEGRQTSAGISEHEKGEAADLSTSLHFGTQLETAARQAGFRAVGIGHLWIHVDTRDDKERRWTYGN